MKELDESLPSTFTRKTSRAHGVHPRDLYVWLDGKAVWSPAERNWNTAPATPSVPTETATG